MTSPTNWTGDERRIDVARDLGGIKHYLPLFLEEATGATLKPEEIPHGYRRWIAHLMLIDSLAATSDLMLTADEAQGIGLLRGARDQFASTHDRCPAPGCGRWKRSYFTTCPCGYNKQAAATRGAA